MKRFAWAFAVTGAVVLLIAVGAVALTRPSVATPVARAVLGGDSKVTLERAWVSYGPGPVAHLRAVEIEGRGHAEVVDAEVNVLGVLPGFSLLPTLSVTDGALLLELGPSRRSRPPGILDEVVRVDLTRVRLDVLRPERDGQTFDIAAAQGQLRSGSFTLEGAGGGATITLEGEAATLSLAGFEGEIRVEGDNFADLAALLGFAAPDTPRYVLTGELRRDGETWVFGPFAGDVGDSDLAGTLRIDFSGERPFVRADLTSQSLDFDDLGVLVGAPTAAEDGGLNARQEEIQADYEADAARAIPDTELDLDRIDAVDADVTFRADAVRAGQAPLEEISARILLEDSVLRFEELVFTAPQGRLEATGGIDARDPANVEGSLAGTLDGFALDQIGGGRVLRGDLSAEFDVVFSGRRTRDAFASATGDAAAWSTNAEIRALVEEAAGLDLGEVLTLLLSESEEDPEFRPARCLVAIATIEDGVAQLDPAVLDTADSMTRVRGAVDLETERIDLETTADAKDVSWGSLLGAAGVGGTLRDPEFRAPFEGAALQAGAAALLGGLTAGLAGLPFIEPGLGEDAPCGRLLAVAEAFAEGEEELDAVEEDAPGAGG